MVNLSFHAHVNHNKDIYHQITEWTGIVELPVNIKKYGVETLRPEIQAASLGLSQIWSINSKGGFPMENESQIS